MRGDMIPEIRRRKDDSSSLKGICSVWKHVEEGCKWQIGDGSCVSFWKDKWLDLEKPLCDYM